MVFFGFSGHGSGEEPGLLVQWWYSFEHLLCAQVCALRVRAGPSAELLMGLSRKRGIGRLLLILQSLAHELAPTASLSVLFSIRAGGSVHQAFARPHTVPRSHTDHVCVKCIFPHLSPHKPENDCLPISVALGRCTGFEHRNVKRLVGKYIPSHTRQFALSVL